MADLRDNPAAELRMKHLSSLVRPRYFTGQLLSADDLRDEQAYFLERLRRQNRFLHGWGVVSGLQVHTEGSNRLVVEPDLAIDCVGNELVVPEELPLSTPVNSSAGYVVLMYQEVLLRPTPAPDSSIEHTRIREGVSAMFERRNPVSGHGARRPGTPVCGRDHALSIARVARSGRTWKTTRLNRVA